MVFVQYNKNVIDIQHAEVLGAGDGFDRRLIR